MRCPFVEAVYMGDMLFSMGVDPDVGKCPFRCAVCDTVMPWCWLSPAEDPGEEPHREAAGDAAEELEEHREYEVHAVLVPVAEGVAGEREAEGVEALGTPVELCEQELEVTGVVQLVGHRPHLGLGHPEDGDGALRQLVEELRVVVPNLDRVQKRTLSDVESNKLVLSVHTVLLAAVIALLVLILLNR